MSRAAQKNAPKAARGTGKRNNSNPSGADGKNLGQGRGFRRLSSDFETKFISEKGTKPKNKDYFGFVELDGFVCWVVAESHDNDKDVVSAKIAVDTVLSMFVKKPSLSKRKLKSHIAEAHRQLKLQSNRYNLKASIMVVATNYTKMRYAHCGNCRLNLFRGDSISIKSRDQSLYQDMISKGLIPDDGEHGLEESRNLSSYLGKHGILKVDVSKKTVLYDEDILLLSTWGFWEKVTTLEMLDALEEIEEPLEYLEELQDLFLSKQEDTINNHTIAAIFAHKTFQEPNNKRKIIKMALIIGIPVLIVVISLSILSYRRNVRRNRTIATIASHESRGDTFIVDRNYDRALFEFDSAIRESRELRETRWRRGRENREIREALEVRQRVTQLIVDGDALFASSRYRDARRSFENALLEARNNIDFFDLLEIADIENKISLCDDFEYTTELISLADYQAELGQYDRALANLSEARRIAERNRNIDAGREINLRLERLRSQIEANEAAESEANRIASERERAERLQEIEILELEADRALREGNFEQAISMFNRVQASYIELNEMARAFAIEQKIVDANNSIRQLEADEQAIIAEGHVRIGDMYMLENRFSDALVSYRSARDIFSLIRRPDDVVRVNENISLAQTRQREHEIMSAIYEINQIEEEGDAFLLEGIFWQARERYRQAQALFRGINQMERVLILQDKIRDVDALEAELIERILEHGEV